MPDPADRRLEIRRTKADGVIQDASGLRRIGCCCFQRAGNARQLAASAGERPTRPPDWPEKTETTPDSKPY